MTMVAKLVHILFNLVVSGMALKVSLSEYYKKGLDDTMIQGLFQGSSVDIDREIEPYIGDANTHINKTDNFNQTDLNKFFSNETHTDKQAGFKSLGKSVKLLTNKDVDQSQTNSWLNIMKQIFNLSPGNEKSETNTIKETKTSDRLHKGDRTVVKNTQAYNGTKSLRHFNGTDANDETAQLLKVKSKTNDNDGKTKNDEVKGTLMYNTQKKKANSHRTDDESRALAFTEIKQNRTSPQQRDHFHEVGVFANSDHLHDNYDTGLSNWTQNERGRLNQERIQRNKKVLLIKNKQKVYWKNIFVQGQTAHGPDMNERNISRAFNMPNHKDLSPRDEQIKNLDELIQNDGHVKKLTLDAMYNYLENLILQEMCPCVEQFIATGAKCVNLYTYFRESSGLPMPCDSKRDCAKRGDMFTYLRQHINIASTAQFTVLCLTEGKVLDHHEHPLRQCDTPGKPVVLESFRTKFTSLMSLTEKNLQDLKEAKKRQIGVDITKYVEKLEKSFERLEGLIKRNLQNLKEELLAKHEEEYTVLEDWVDDTVLEVNNLMTVIEHELSKSATAK